MGKVPCDVPLNELNENLFKFIRIAMKKNL